MHIENRDQMISLLKLAGYVQRSIVRSQTDVNYYSSTFTHARLPQVVMVWVKSCKVSGYSSFLSFDEAWEIISTEALHDS